MDTDLMGRWSGLGAIRWGVDDCVPLCADEVLARAGVDPIADLRPMGQMPYSTREERNRYAPNILRAMIRGVAGRPMFERINVNKAPVRSLGLGQFGPMWALGMSAGGGWWAFRAEVGVQMAPQEMVRRAWIWHGQD